MTLVRTSRIALVLAGGILASALTGCGATQTTHTPEESGSTLGDPLMSIDAEELAELNDPIVHELAEGPAEYTIAIPERITALRVYVACEPNAEFKVDTLDNFYAGGCSRNGDGYGEYPVTPGTTTTTIALDVPEGIEHYLVAIPIY